MLSQHNFLAERDINEMIDIKQMFSNLDFDEGWSFSHTKYETYSHNYHRYPAKFIRPLAQKLIEEESNEGDTVCDTFGGCGTTLLEAKLLGRKSIGFDINPVAKFIAEVKNKAINPDNLSEAYISLSERLNRQSNVNDDYNSTHERIKYWFTEDSYRILCKIYEAILKENSEDIQKFFLCAFSHCLKNSSRWLMKSIKPTVDKNKKQTDILSTYNRHLKIMINKNKLLYQRLKQDKRLSLRNRIYLQDITTLEKTDEIDLIVTSPPYVTSYEYGDLHQLTLLWFGQKKYRNWQKYIHDFNRFKSDFIGSNIASIEMHNYADIKIGSLIGVDIIEELKAKNKNLAYKVGVYFLKMHQAFSVMYEILKEGGKACIVIGNTRLLGVPILNAQVALEQLIDVGFCSNYEVIKRNANTNKMITPFRHRKTGKFVSHNSQDKVVAYHEEYILKVSK